MSELDEQREFAAKCLRDWAQIEMRYTVRGIARFGHAARRLDTMAATYVSEQAKYTNMLRDWESEAPGL